MRLVCSVVRWCVLAAAASGISAQTFTVSLLDGSRLRAEWIGLLGRGAEANLELRVEGVRRLVPVARVLALQGGAATAGPGVCVHLVGGDRLRGELVGGDQIGETFTVRSPTLGEIRVPVDRLELIAFGDRARGLGAEALRFPAEASSDEVLFLRTERGFDTVLGAIHRFESRGILFEWAQGDEAQLFPYASLEGIALRDGDGPEPPLPVRLVTKSGDVVGVALDAIQGGRLQLRGEGDRKLSVPLSEIAALTWLGADREFLSDLDPIRVEQRGTGAGDGGLPLYAYRCDQAAAGGFLVVGGETYGKGLGVHSKCELVYRVPAGFHHLHALVGIDDGVLGTPVRGVAEVSIEAAGKVVFGPVTVRSGQQPRDVGLVAVEAGQLVTLVADFGAGWFVGDRVDWLQAVLSK